MPDDMSEDEFDAAFAQALPAKLAREYGMDPNGNYPDTKCDPVRFHIHVTSTCPGVTCACLRRGENIA